MTVKGDYLDAELVLEYIERFITEDANGRTKLCNGRAMTKTAVSNIANWRAGRQVPSIFLFDRMLTRHYLPYADFEIFCEDKGKSPWAAGHPPDWHEEDWIHEDKNWTDERAAA